MAARYWVGGNANWDATAGTKWSLTSGGAGGEAVPTSADDVHLDNGTGTGNVTITAAATCLSLDCTGYIGTLTYNQNLSVVSAVTYVAGMTVAADLITRVLTVTPTAGSTLTANTQTHPCKLKLAGSSQTHVLADAWVISGILEANTATTLNGSTISAVGLLMTNTLQGTTAITLTGGTWSGGSAVKNNLTLAGNITVSGVESYSTGTLTYSSGTITVAGSTLNISGAATLDTGGMTWETVRHSAGVITLNSTLLATTLQINNPSSTPGYSGAAGFTVGTLINNVAIDTNRSISFDSLRTYTVTTAINLIGTQFFQWTLVSSSATVLTSFVLQSGATQSVAWVSATRIDSSAGQPIRSLNGVLNDPVHPTLNWDTPGTGAQFMFG